VYFLIGGGLAYFSPDSYMNTFVVFFFFPWSFLGQTNDFINTSQQKYKQILNYIHSDYLTFSFY